MTDIKQCWAYNKEGQRCEHPAGHPGNHVIMAEWSDEECFAPMTTPLSRALGAAPVLAPPPPPPPATKCVACQHSHRGGECKCGCYEFIG